MAATLDEICRNTQYLLDKWQGGHARLWEFVASFDTLTLRIVAHDRPGNLHVVCTPCVSIAGPVHWANCKLQLHCEQTQAGETLFFVRDEHAHLQVVCRGVAAFENVEPLY
jgi:hypothetical protein